LQDKMHPENVARESTLHIQSSEGTDSQSESKTTTPPLICGHACEAILLHIRRHNIIYMGHFCVSLLIFWLTLIIVIIFQSKVLMVQEPSPHINCQIWGKTGKSVMRSDVAEKSKTGALFNRPNALSMYHFMSKWYNGLHISVPIEQSLANRW
jgi:hypothetical protein